MAIDSSLQLSLQLKNGTQVVSNEQLAATGSDNEAIIQYYSVAIGATDQAVALGPLASAKLLLMVSDQALTVKINGSLVAVEFKVLLLQASGVTSLTVSNAGASVANLRIVAAGA